MLSETIHTYCDKKLQIDIEPFYNISPYAIQQIKPICKEPINFDAIDYDASFKCATKLNWYWSILKHTLNQLVDASRFESILDPSTTTSSTSRANAKWCSRILSKINSTSLIPSTSSSTYYSIICRCKFSANIGLLYLCHPRTLCRFEYTIFHLRRWINRKCRWFLLIDTLRLTWRIIWNFEFTRIENVHIFCIRAFSVRPNRTN